MSQDYFNVSMTLRDEHNRETTRTLELIALAPTATLGDLSAAVATEVAKYMAVTNLGLAGVSVQVPQSVTQTLGAAGSNTDIGMTLRGRLDKIGSPGFVLKIPDPIDAVKLPYGKIDLTDSDLADLLDSYSGVVKTLVLSDGDEVAIFTDGDLDAR